ncbi:MAG: hypothetical protein LBJ67_01355, partial [Planctomycetaceae bacterium]|nr:hypothetical protein [Planctomycetaceae bacterium]
MRLKIRNPRIEIAPNYLHSTESLRFKNFSQMIQKRWLSLLILIVLCLTMSIPLSNQFSAVYNEYGRLASGQINLISGD